MKPLSFVVLGALVAICANSLVQAAPKNNPQPKGAPGETVRYFALTDLLGDLTGDVIIKERRQGARLVSVELDACHTVSTTSRRRDRFVLPLRVDGNRLTGTGQSQEDKLPITVNMTRRVSGNTFDFEGSIGRGSETINVSSTGNTDVSEEEFADMQADGVEINDKPRDFTEFSPHALAARVARASLANLLSSLREQNVRIVAPSLVLGCDVLRSGTHVVRLEVDSERASAVLAKLKSTPGVAAAGWIAGSTNIERAIRFAPAGWLDGSGKLNRNKMAETVGIVASKAFAAQSRTATWDATVGELSIVLKRPAQVVPDLKLTEVITMSVFVGPETLSANARRLLWVGNINSEIVDEGSTPKLMFEAGEGNENTPEPEGSDGLIESLAKELRGETWDAENSRWTR